MSRFDQIKSDAEYPAKNNLAGIIAPTATDDSGAGYEVGSLWIDTAANNAYICVDATAATAVWTETTSLGVLTLPELTDIDDNILPVSPTNADDGRILHYDKAVDQWVADDIVTHGTVVINAYSGEAGTIAKGTPVYLIGGFANDLHQVGIADADDPNKMPVIGFAAEDLLTATTDAKHVMTFGKLQGVDTTTATSPINGDGVDWVAGDILYMSETAGQLTTTRPTGATTEIQRIAQVLKAGTTDGQLLIFNTARTAGLPNLPTDNVWVGNGNNEPVATPLSNNTAAATLSSWTLDAGDIYYADVTHNLNSDDVLVEVFDSVTKETVLVEKIDRINLNTVRIFIVGNTASLRVVITNALLGYQGSSGRNVVLNPTSPYLAQNNDIIIWDCTTGNKVVDLPPEATSANFRIDVKKIDVTANTITIDPDGVELIEGGSAAVITTQYEALSIVPGGGWWILAAV